MLSKKIELIYLIDDDTITNFINARLIKRVGITEDLIVSLNGKEALNLLEKRLADGKNCPGLLLLDINMPVMDGFEFMDNFLKLDFKNKNEVIIYMLTTSENFKDVEKAKTNNNISGFLNKPLTEEKIRKIIQTHFLKQGNDFPDVKN